MDIQQARSDVKKMIDNGAPDDVIDEYLSDNGITLQQLRASKTVSLSDSIDTERGAPAITRAIVGPGYRNTDDRLKTLKKSYPDAQIYGKDNFVFTDPETKRATLYNPPGLDSGDVAEHGRIFAEMGGGAVGGILGAAGSAPSGFMSSPVTVPLGVGLGAEAGGQIYDLGLEYLSGRTDTRGLAQRTGDAAAGVGLNAIGQKVSTELPGMAKSMFQGIKNRTAGATAPQLLKDYQIGKIPIEGAGGAINSSRPIQGTSSALTNLPTSANIMERAQNRTLQGVTNYADDVFSKFGTAATKEQSGTAAKKGLNTFVENFKLKSSELYNNLDNYIKPTEKVQLDKTINNLGSKLGQFADAPEIGKSIVPQKFQGWLTDIEKNNGQLTWAQIKELRSYVGDMANDPRVITDLPKSKWKELYGALSTDLEAHAKIKGAEAAKSFTRATNYYKAGLARIESVEKIMNSETSERAFDLAFSGAKNGGSQLRQLRKSIPSDMWGDVVSGKLRQLGAAKPGVQSADGDVFSASTYLTNWNNISADAKKAMFGGNKYKVMSDDLDRLARITGSLKDTERMVNHSGTAQQHTYMNILNGGILFGGAGIGFGAAGVPGAVAAATASLVLPNQAAKLMTNPRFIKWLANGVKIAPDNYNGLIAHAGRLSIIAKYEPEIKEEIQQFQDSIRSVKTIKKVNEK